MNSWLKSKILSKRKTIVEHCKDNVVVTNITDLKVQFCFHYISLVIICMLCIVSDIIETFFILFNSIGVT